MSTSPPRRQVSDRRKGAYYLGSALGLIGLLMFCSVFVSACANFGNFDGFIGRAQSQMGLALGGMALLFVGSVVANVGRLGRAGSGVVLDPEQQRKDLEPWNRMAGGMIKDVLDETGLVPPAGQTQPEVRVRCTACKALNDEHARFCSQCGKAIA